MTRNTFFVLSMLLLLLVGAIAAAAGHRLWGTSGQTVQNLPGASGEYRKIYHRLSIGDSAMDISGTIRIYDQEHSGMFREEKPFRFCRTGSQFYMQLSYLRTYCDGRLVLSVDTVHGQMNVMKATAGMQDPLMVQLPVEKLFNDTARFGVQGVVSQEGGERVLSIRSDSDPGIRVCRVYYDTVNYRMRRAELEWWKDQAGLDTAKGKLWLIKVDYRYRSREDAEPGRALYRYIRLEPDGAIKPAAAYSSYVVNVIPGNDQKPNP